MKKLVVVILIIFCSSLLEAQEYHSNFEKNVLNLYEKDSINYDFFHTLSVVDSLMTTQKAETSKDMM